jgi:hypothetical protein
MANRKSANSSSKAVVTDQDAVATLVQDGSTPATEPVATIPSGENGSDGTNTGAVDGTADAHDKAGGPATDPLAASSKDTPESATGSEAGNLAGLAEALAMTGCRDFDDLIENAITGRDLRDAIAAHAMFFAPHEDLGPIEHPVDIVGALVALVSKLQRKLDEARAISRAARAPGASDPVAIEKRSFVALGRINLDNVLVEVGGGVLIDKKQHEALSGLGVVDPEWDEGI